jgi:predicted RNA-binding Zn-ribbon protein involved in translation (DUF1610 family)
MEAEKNHATKPGRTFDSAYSFSFSIALGLVLFIAGLVISLTFGADNVTGLIFGIPLLIAGLLLPLFMMRNLFSKSEVSGVCPYCSVPIKTSDATLKLQCPACGREVLVRNMKLVPVNE